MEIFRPAKFCWYLMFRSVVGRTFHRPRREQVVRHSFCRRVPLRALIGTHGPARLDVLAARPGHTHQSISSFTKSCQKKRLRFLKRRDGGLTANSRILLQEFIQCFSALQIIEQCLERNARSAKNGLPAMNFRVLHDYAIRQFSHDSSRQNPIIAFIHREFR